MAIEFLTPQESEEVRLPVHHANIDCPPSSCWARTAGFAARGTAVAGRSRRFELPMSAAPKAGPRQPKGPM